MAGRGDETASATREPWVDANGYWIGYLRALYPHRPAVLGYLPELGDRGVPFDTLELALIEAWVAGGNYILSVEPDYRKALLEKAPKAMEAWKQLGQTGRWLRENIALFRQNVPPTIMVLVESGEQTPEIANLMYRRNASPALCAVAALPAPDPRSRIALVAANLRTPDPAVAKRILTRAEAGTTVIADHPWWRTPGMKPVRSEANREYFR